MAKAGKNRQETAVGSTKAASATAAKQERRRVKVARPCADQGYHHHRRPCSWPGKADSSDGSSSSRIAAVHRETPLSTDRRLEVRANSSGSCNSSSQQPA